MLRLGSPSRMTSTNGAEWYGTLPIARGHGVGEKLVRRLIEEAPARGATAFGAIRASTTLHQSLVRKAGRCQTLRPDKPLVRPRFLPVGAGCLKCHDGFSGLPIDLKTTVSLSGGNSRNRRRCSRRYICNSKRSSGASVSTDLSPYS